MDTIGSLVWGVLHIPVLLLLGWVVAADGHDHLTADIKPAPTVAPNLSVANGT